LLDSHEQRKIRLENYTKPMIDAKNVQIPKYSHQEYFLQLNDDSKILATINNDYSTIKN
jgi:hypothetical protein